MKPSLSILFLSASLVFAAQARATILPDACGDDKIKFEVKTEKGQSAPAVPEAGKAQVVFLENENQPIGPFMHATVRFGVDGAWVGADNGNSYFALSVVPGVHHLCANWQSSLGRFDKDVDLTSFTAAPGRIYYFAANVTVESKYVVTFGLSQLNENEASTGSRRRNSAPGNPNS